MYKILLACMSLIFLSSMPAEARRSHHYGKHSRNHNIERHSVRTADLPRDCSGNSSVDVARVQQDFVQKEAVKYTELTWQEVYESSNMPFTEISPMMELPVKLIQAKQTPSNKEKIGVAIFGAIVFFGSIFSILPRKRKRI